MIEFVYIPIILLLYVRTFRFSCLIDDHVPRGGYLLNLTEKPDHYTYYDQRRSILATVTNIGVFMASCLGVHLNFGWQAALLYAVFPLNVCGVAWTTGNYYQSTVLLILTCYYFVTHFGWVGDLLGAVFYVSALGSTVSAIPFALLLPFISQEHWAVYGLYFATLLKYLFGYRFQTGLKMRAEKHANIHVKSWKTHPNRLIFATKLMAYYIALSIAPMRLGFWHTGYKQEMKEGKAYKPTRVFWLSLICCVLFLCLGYQENLVSALWWFAFMLLFGQIFHFGMTIAERYTLIANVGFCLMVAELLSAVPFLYTVLATLWFCRSWYYVKDFKNNRDLLLANIDNFPEAEEPMNNLGCHYKERGNYIKAVECFKMAIKYAVNESYNNYSNLMDCLARSGQYGDALLYGRLALRLCPEDKIPLTTSYIAQIEEKCRDIDRKKKLLKRQGII